MGNRQTPTAGGEGVECGYGVWWWSGSCCRAVSVVVDGRPLRNHSGHRLPV